MIYLLILINAYSLYALDNGVGITPPMGWNAGSRLGCNITQNLIKTNADLLISLGLASKGYNYVIVDDCWQIDRNNDTHQIITDSNRFPNGMQSLSRFIHQKGLLFGLYSDAGFSTCQGRPGSLNYETYDAQTYAKWEVDYLKYDNCFNDHTSAKLRYPVMRDALNKTGRKIFFAMSNWGQQYPETWAQPVANSWRTTGNIQDDWHSFLDILDLQEGRQQYSGPGGWNDPDILEVGNSGMTINQYQSQFALWALLKAPLIIGVDLNTISPQALNILSNEQLIAINQDKLGIQAKRVKQQIYTDGTKDYFAARISGERYVIGLFNRQMKTTDFTISLVADLKLSKGLYVLARDITNRKQLGIFHSDIITFKNIEAHSAMVIVITPLPSASII